MIINKYIIICAYKIVIIIVFKFECKTEYILTKEIIKTSCYIEGMIKKFEKYYEFPENIIYEYYNSNDYLKEQILFRYNVWKQTNQIKNGKNCLLIVPTLRDVQKLKKILTNFMKVILVYRGSDDMKNLNNTK